MGMFQTLTAWMGLDQNKAKPEQAPTEVQSGLLELAVALDAYRDKHKTIRPRTPQAVIESRLKRRIVDYCNAHHLPVPPL